LFGSALAGTFKNNDNFLGLVVMPWQYDPGADYVFMNVGLGPQLAVCDEVANPSFWTARNFTKYLAENGHCNSPEQLFSVFST
jgi:hypothetical protein